MKTAHLGLILGAIARERLRWAREHLYSLLILSPLVLGLTYFGVGRLVSTNAGWELSPPASAAAAVAFAAALIVLSMSRAGAELYHLRRPEALFDALPLGPDTHLYVALAERVARTAAVGAAALVARNCLGGTLADAALLPPLILFIALAALAEMLAALEWIHWSRAQHAGHAAGALAALAVCAAACGPLLLAVVRPEKLPAAWRVSAVAAGFVLTAVLFPIVRALHRRWRAVDIEHAKRLGAGRNWKGGRLRRLFKETPVAALLERDLRLTLKAFSSAVYVAAALAALWVAALAAVLTTGALPAAALPAGWAEATWLPRVVAVKVACVLASLSLCALTPVLVAHQRPHLWLERALGAKGTDVWRAKLWYARVVSGPAPLAAWAVGALAGAAPAVYVLPLLGETLWLWWLVGTLAGALAYEVPEQPGLGVILTACAGLAVGLFVAALWPMGLALYVFGIGQMCLRGEHRARFHLLAEAA